MGWLKTLGGFLKDSFLALFLIRKGQNDEVLKGKDKEVKDAKKAGKLKDKISNVDDDTLDNSLKRMRTPKK